MTESSNPKISRHYSQGDLRQKIESALKKSDRDLSKLDPDDLRYFDELHIGGKSATLHLAEKANLKPNHNVLDVGCGLGGPARTLAMDFGCQVTGIDISEELCEVAGILTEAVDLRNKVDFKQGDALAIPYPDHSFDVVWSQHCSMNIQDKDRLFSEFRRVLKNSGQLVTHDIVCGPIQPIHFPVPWARSEDISFLEPANILEDRIGKAGFRLHYRAEITELSIQWFNEQRKLAKTAPKNRLHQFLIFGDDLREMGPNILKNMLEKRIAVIEGIWR